MNHILKAPQEESHAQAILAPSTSASNALSTEQAPHNSHDELLRQIDDDLQKLTSTEAHHAFHAHVQNHLDDHDPMIFNEAMASPSRDKWIIAMREEFNSLHLNNTWEVATSNQKHHDGIGSKWVFKTKLNPDGTTRFKA